MSDCVLTSGLVLPGLAGRSLVFGHSIWISSRPAGGQLYVVEAAFNELILGRCRWWYWVDISGIIMKDFNQYN